MNGNLERREDLYLERTRPGDNALGALHSRFELACLVSFLYGKLKSPCQSP